MKKLLPLYILFLSSKCTQPCNEVYRFELLFTSPVGASENRYYYVANCKRDYWDTSKIKEFILSSEEIKKDIRQIKNVAFYSSDVNSISRNEADLDEVELEKKLIVRYYLYKNVWSIESVGRLRD